MRLVTKAMILTGLAGPAIAAVIVAGAGTASAQTANPSASSISTVANFPPPFCSIFQKERWNLNGVNEVDVTYLGTLHFTYTVDLVQHGSCLNGWLDDPYFHVLRPIFGTVYGNTVTFSFTYPSFVEGTRTYTATSTDLASSPGTGSRREPRGPTSEPSLCPARRPGRARRGSGGPSSAPFPDPGLTEYAYVQDPGPGR